VANAVSITARCAAIRPRAMSARPATSSTALDPLSVALIFGKIE
jgi:hypothetical protein